jgi:hypothetical protein
MLKEELKEIKKAKADLEEKLNEKDKDLLESNSAKRAINELYQESQKQRQDLMVIHFYSLIFTVYIYI